MIPLQIRHLARRGTLAVYVGAVAALMAQSRGVQAQAAAPAAQAQAPEPPTRGQAPSVYDKVWAAFSEWYNDESNPVVQQVLFSGRYQHEFAAIAADQGDLEEWNVRRMRIGSRVSLFRDFTLHGEVDLNPQEHDPFYVRLTDAYVQWNKFPRFTVTAGKQGVQFTVDGDTSSKELLAIDRSNLSNNLWFPQEYMPGISVSGRIAPWVYRGGVYSAGQMNREFGDFTGDYFTLAVVGYDFAQRLGVSEAALTGNYVYQHPDERNTFTRALEHVMSVHFTFEVRAGGLRSDFSAGQGALGQSDLWAVMVMPYVNLTRKLQAVGRYTAIRSEDVNGIRLATYESSVVSGRGDEFSEVYVGANYYFYGHKLKVQSGVQWSDMNDRANDGGAYSGVSWTTGVRVGW